mmetsp:Transcript_23991/g.44081  ORF Transcript_23991/g.44081 Transcript_23991/m.44081 type:complete len:689 (-) Transcript_23991:78-2144(-)
MMQSERRRSISQADLVGAASGRRGSVATAGGGVGLADDDFEQEEIALEQRAKQREAKEKARRQRVKEQKAREQADKQAHQQMLGILKEAPRIKQNLGLHKCSPDEVVLHLQGKSEEVEGSLYDFFRTAGLQPTQAAEAVELVDPACRSIAFNYDRTSGGSLVGAASAAEEVGIGLLRKLRWQCRRVSAGLLLLASGILGFTVFWEYVLANVNWKDGLCNIVDFSNRTCNVDDCTFMIEVAQENSVQDYLVPSWFPQVERSFTSAETTFIGDAFRCCSDVGFDGADCCQFWDEELYMFCDNWPHRTDSQGVTCPSGTWRCLFKTEDGTVTHLKVYMPPDMTVEIVLSVCLALLSVIVCMAKTLWRLVLRPVVDTLVESFWWCTEKGCLRGTVIRSSRRNSDTEINITGQKMSSSDTRMLAPQGRAAGIEQMIEKVRIQAAGAEGRRNTMNSSSSFRVDASTPSSITWKTGNSPQAAAEPTEVVATQVKPEDYDMSTGHTLYKTVDGMPIRMAVAKMCITNAPEDRPGFVAGDLVKQLRQTAAQDVFKPLVDPVPYGWPGEPGKRKNSTQTTAVGRFDFRPGTAPPKEGDVYGDMRPPGTAKSSRRPKTRGGASTGFSAWPETSSNRAPSAAGSGAGVRVDPFMSSASLPSTAVTANGRQGSKSAHGRQGSKSAHGRRQVMSQEGQSIAS